MIQCSKNHPPVEMEFVPDSDDSKIICPKCGKRMSWQGCDWEEIEPGNIECIICGGASKKGITIPDRFKARHPICIGCYSELESYFYD